MQTSSQPNQPRLSLPINAAAQSSPLEPAEACLERMGVICDEMRGLILDPGTKTSAGAQDRLDDLREALRDEVDTNSDIVSDCTPHQGRILTSLDPQSIKTLMPAGLFSIDLTCWNEIVDHITPEIVDAYCAAGCKVHDFPLPGEQVKAMPAATMAYVIPLQTEPFVTFLIRVGVAARDGKLPASVSLQAFRYWLAHWPMPAPTVEAWKDITIGLTMLRLIAALDGLAPDDWAAQTLPDCARALALTRSAHGRLKLHALLPDIETLILDPVGEIARLARHVPG